MMVNGIQLALLELLFFFSISYGIRLSHIELLTLSKTTYYWLSFTVMTGIWEFFYLGGRTQVKGYAKKLLEKKTHVWTNNYQLINLMPNLFSKLFYSEYGAYADREYIRLRDDWSLAIEGSHAFVCGWFSFLALLAKGFGWGKYELLICLAMSSQFMNSILYLAQYLIECHSVTSVNYNDKRFPCGLFLLNRPFMYINVLWFLMPSIILFNLIFTTVVIELQ